MCGIVGYVGPRPSQDILLAGLARLEYRGYDSAGVAVIDGDGVLGMRKKAGKLAVLRDSLADAPLPDGSTGIGHTRWATHGGPTDGNAHPHLADDDKLAVIHNGIIENFSALRDELLADGVVFRSETDTEVAAALLGREYAGNGGDLQLAFRSIVNRLEGAFTLLAMHQDHPGLVVGARRNSPLVIGLGEGENFLGSDVAAFIEYTRKALAIGQDQIVSITPESVTVMDFAGTPVEPEPFDVSWDAAAAEKGGWSSFMAKEVAEQPEAVANTIRGRIHDGQVVIPELDGLDELFVGINRVIITACGTASYAALVGKYAIEQWARVAVDVELAHEFRYRDPVIGADTLVVSISQSGETMDTLMAVKYARERGARTLSVCNTQGATIPRESDAVVYTHAGPEVAVASTKAVFATSEVKFGIIPSAISPYVIRAIGERQAYRYFQTAERIDAARARELGLAHEVATVDELDATLQRVLDALATGGPQSQRAATELIRAVANRPIDDAVVEDTARRIASLRATDEAREGLAAFLDKRPAAWTLG